MCYESEYFHVMVQGINREYIFKKEIWKKKYLDSILEKCKDQNVIVLAYCIMDNHAHMLLYTKQIKNLTKFMSSINTKYAIYYNKTNGRCGFVFRDRYRCENILTQNHLQNCIRYIHNNPVEAGICKNQKEYEFSSFKDYMNGNIHENVLNLVFGNGVNYKEKLNEKIENYYFIDMNNEFGKVDTKLDEEDVKNLMQCDLTNKKEICRVANILKKKYNLSNNEIIKLMNLKRSTFYKIRLCQVKCVIFF